MTHRPVIISCDGHATGRPEDYVPYIEPSYREQYDEFVRALLAGRESVTALTLNLIGAIFGTIGSMFSGPIMIIGLAMAYYDLRIRKEALDLQMMLESLDAPRA